MLKNSIDTICGCFPTGRHYPGIASALEAVEISVVGLSASFSHDVIWKDTPLVVIDFETTGLKADEDRVLEVGLVCIDGGIVTESKNWLVNPAMPVPDCGWMSWKNYKVALFNAFCIASSSTMDVYCRSWL